MILYIHLIVFGPQWISVVWSHTAPGFSTEGILTIILKLGLWLHHSQANVQTLDQIWLFHAVSTLYMIIGCAHKQ